MLLIIKSISSVMVHILANYVMIAMMAWVPLSDHAYYEKEEQTLERYQDIAFTIAEVASERDPLFQGENGVIKTALLLASIASTEGVFRKDVDTCKVGGDFGMAWGLWQTHYSKYLTCSDRKVAANIAFDMIEDSFKWCKRYPMLDHLAIYTDGKCSRNQQRSRFRMSRALDWYEKHKSINDHE